MLTGVGSTVQSELHPKSDPHIEQLASRIRDPCEAIGVLPTKNDLIPTVSEKYVYVRDCAIETRRRWKAGDCSLEELKEARRCYRKERRIHRRKILEYEFRPGLQRRTHLQSLVIEGEETWDKTRWEQALRAHGLSSYTSEAERTRTNTKLEEMRRRLLREGDTEYQPISIGLLLRARSRLRCGKAVGKDNVSVSMLKHIPWAGCLVILQCFRSLFKREYCTPTEWRQICIQLMPKSPKTCEFSDTRALSLLSCLSKWYVSCLTLLAVDHLKRSVPSRVMLFGFVAGRRTHEITGGLKRLAQHATEWGKDHTMHLASLDVYRAFDNVQIADVAESLEGLHFNLELAYALVEGLAENRADLSFQQVDAHDIGWDACIRTGSVEAPLFWICECILMFGSIVCDWERKGFGVQLTAQAGGRHVTHAIWADNVLLCSSSEKELTTMIADISGALYARNYSWKPSSLQYIKFGDVTNRDKPLCVSFSVAAESLTKYRRAEIQLKQTNSLEVLGTILENDMVSHADVDWVISKAKKAFWSEGRYYRAQSIHILKRLRRYETRVRSRLLFGVEGMTADRATIEKLHRTEGALLRVLVWRRKRTQESWQQFYQSISRKARGALRAAGMPSLPQLFLYKQWCWAKDVAMTVQSLSDDIPSGGNEDQVFVQDCVPVRGDSPVLVQMSAEHDSQMEAERKPNRRNLISAARDEAKRRRLGEMSQRSNATPAPTPQVVDASCDDSFSNLQYKRRRVRRGMEGASTGDAFMQARLSMMQGASPWTQERDDFIKTLSTKEAKEFTRCRRNAPPIGLKSWGVPFEEVGGAFWYLNLQWTQEGWRSFVRTLLKKWSLEHVLEFCVLPEPSPWRSKYEEEGVVLSEEAEAKKADMVAKRLAYNFEHASNWNYVAQGIPIELSGDSQVVVNWLLGQHVCTTEVYCDIIAHIQEILYRLSCDCQLEIRPPSWGHDPWKWFYREGNQRADAETWKARTGREHTTFDPRLPFIRRDNIKGICGYFDGGRSSHGVGIGWVIDILVLPHTAPTLSHASWLHDIASEAAALPPTCTVCQAELLASQRLAVGVERLLHLAGSAL